MKLTLPTDSAARKRHPLARGPLAYAPAILAGVAEVCIDGNDKHNPGQPLHHARGKSADHADCIVRHLMDVQDIVAEFDRGAHRRTPTENEALIDALLTEMNQLAWRALMFGQEIHETYGDAPLAPGSRLPEPETSAIPNCKAHRMEGPFARDEYCHLPEDHEGDHVGPFGSWPAVAFPQEQAAAMADEIVGQIMCEEAVAPVPAGADWREPTIDRLTWPPVAPQGIRSRGDTLWNAGDAWYFNRFDDVPTIASITVYHTEAAARAAYWADRDSD